MMLFLHVYSSLYLRETNISMYQIRVGSIADFLAEGMRGVVGRSGVRHLRRNFLVLTAPSEMTKMCSSKENQDVRNDFVADLARTFL